MSKLKELEKRLKDEPNSLGLRVLVASALHEAGRRADSVELYRSVAIAYRDQGRLQQAITVCQSILAIAPDDALSLQLLATLAPAPDERLTPPWPPRPRASPDLEPADLHDDDIDDDMASVDVTPLPAPLPYHVAYPTASMPVVSPTELPPSLADELARYPQIAGIANAARKISASLIAASRQEEDAEAEDLSGELQTRRIPRISTEDLLKIAGPPPSVTTEQIGVPELSELDDVTLDRDDEPTLMPSDGTLHAVDDETTRPRELPIRGRPPSIAPPTAATGPLAGAFFAPVPPRDRASLLQRFRRRMAPIGTTIVHRGETGHGLVIVVRGLLELQADRPDGAHAVLSTIAPGDYCGETSLLTRTPAMADIVAVVDSEILVLGEADFYEVTGAFPALWIELKNVAERRSRELESRLHG